MAKSKKMANLKKTQSMDNEDLEHIMTHRCLLMTTPPWDPCYKRCREGADNGDKTWLKVANDPNYESLCWECPVLKKMYPNVKKCDYFVKKYGK